MCLIKSLHQARLFNRIINFSQSLMVVISVHFILWFYIKNFKSVGFIIFMSFTEHEKDLEIALRQLVRLASKAKQAYLIPLLFCSSLFIAHQIYWGFVSCNKASTKIEILIQKLVPEQITEWQREGLLFSLHLEIWCYPENPLLPRCLTPPPLCE